MRASTFFALFIAILLGLAALAAARYFGFLQTTTTIVQRDVPPKPEYPKVLVAKKNLYEGIAMTSADVQVRELTKNEYENEYKNNPDKYLPPTAEAAVLRVMNTNLGAGHILLKEHLDPQGIPPGLPERITPKMLAINVSIPKERAAGGLIRKDDYVDVFMTTAISGDKNNPSATSKTACIANNLCVILKRDMLWIMLAPVPENKPLQFTLEANPYRAALIDYAKDKGLLTLVPTSKAPRAKNAKLEAPATFAMEGSKEYANEDQRVAAILRGDRSVGSADLERIFGLPALPIQEAINVEILHGNKAKSSPTQFVRVFNPADRRVIDPDQPSYGYHFSSPHSVEPAPGTAQTPFARPLTKPK